MAEPKILTPAVLTTHALPFTTNANNLKEQADRAVIETSDDFDRAVDFVKICQSQHNAAEEARTNLVKPLNAHVKWINDQFKPITQTLTEAKDAMKKKGSAWKVAEDKRIADEAKETQRLAEEQALEDAQQAIDSGDTERGEAIVEAAAATPEPVAKAPTGRGAHTGASGGIRKTWVGEVSNVKMVCAAIADGALPESIIKEFSKKELNAYAKTTEKEGESNGITITEKKDMSVR